MFASRLSCTRRVFMVSALAGSSALAHAAAKVPSHDAPRARSRTALEAVRSWGCQYQNVDVSKIAASPLDLIVIDPSLDDGARRFVTREDMARLRRKPDGSRRLVLGYLCVGETDIKRWYWPARWKAAPPDWLGAANPNWPGSHHVRFWDSQWQSLIFREKDSLLDLILKIGFDGALLDRVDGYLDWPDAQVDVQGEMLHLVADLAAKARACDPGFILMPQNGEHLLSRTAFLDLIDAHNKECLLTGLAADGQANRPADINWSLGFLKKAQSAGITTLAIEYLRDPAIIEEVRGRLVSLGFVPFIGNRALDRVPFAAGAP